MQANVGIQHNLSQVLEQYGVWSCEVIIAELIVYLLHLPGRRFIFKRVKTETLTELGVLVVFFSSTRTF